MTAFRQTFGCSNCGHEWIEWLDYGTRIDFRYGRGITLIKDDPAAEYESRQLVCPRCGRKESVHRDAGG